MKPRSLTCLLTLAFMILFGRQVCAIGTFVVAPIVQDLRSPARSNGHLIVLKNGNVIAGLIEHQPQQYIIQTPQGSRLIIAHENVDFVCDSMEQVYWGRLSRIRASDHEGLESLFYWCLKNNRTDEAKNQLEVLRAIGSSGERLIYLSDRLDQQINQFNARQAESQQSAVAVQTPLLRPDWPPAIGSMPPLENGNLARDFFTEFEPEFESLPQMTGELTDALAEHASQPPRPSPVFKTIRSPDDLESTEVIQVGFEQAVENLEEPSESNAAYENSDSATVSYVSPPVYQLDGFMRQLPNGSFNNFRLKAERHLIQNCSDCHDLHSTVMPLMHAGKLQSMPIRMSQRNLHSIFRFLNTTSPESSRLLTAAVTAHGGADTPAVSIDSEEYQKMIQWVISLGDSLGKNAGPSLAPTLVPTQPGLKIIPSEPGKFDPSQLSENVVRKIDKHNAPTSRSVRVSANSADMFPTIGEIPDLESLPQGFVPRDEFDPEIFNRQLGRE